MVTLPITTDRLSLRLFTEGDLDDLHALFSDPEVVRYLIWDVLDLDGIWQRLVDRLARTSLEHEGDILSLVIEDRSTGAFAGEVIVQHVSERNAHAEIGYCVAPWAAGRGFATEASMALLHLLFGELGLHRVTAGLDERNLASARVLEKLGMRREALHVASHFVKGEWTSELVYALLADEFAGAADTAV